MYQGDMMVRIKVGKHYKNIRPYMNSSGRRNKPSLEERYHNTVDRFGGFLRTYLIAFIPVCIIFFILLYVGVGSFIFTLEGFSLTFGFVLIFTFIYLWIWILDG